MTQLIQAAFMTPDGKTFATKQEAINHVRIPLIEAALSKLTQKNKDLVAWLLEKKDAIIEGFDAGKLQRVTKAERKALEKEMFIIAEILRDIRDNVHLSQDISQKINTLSANKKIFYTFVIIN